LPCPPYVPFSWTAIVGCRTGGEGSSGCGFLHIRPTLLLKEGGRPARQWKNAVWATAFVRLNFGIHRKRKAPMPTHRGQVPCSVCFAPLGDGKATSSHAHENARTSATDAHSVTYSGKICGSPRFALFRMARCSEAQTAEPRVILDNTLPRPK